MSNSINTNYNAMVALQSLNSTNAQLATTQNRISTGLKVATAQDNGAVWSIATTEKGQVSALDAVSSSLNNSKSVLNVTTQTGTQITDLLNQMKTAAVAAEDTGIDSASRTKYQNQFNSLAKAITNAANSAVFNGKSLISSTFAASISAIGSADGAIKLTSTGQSLTQTGLGLASQTWGTATAAATAAGLVDTALATVTSAMAQYGVDSTSLSNQMTTVSNLQDALNTGIGNLVDADVAKESANLTALQTKQQLGVQALSIANSAPSTLLSLFRG